MESTFDTEYEFYEWTDEDEIEYLVNYNQICPVCRKMHEYLRREGHCYYCDRCGWSKCSI